jgi:SNF2 family DNA or RNA helicase
LKVNGISAIAINGAISVIERQRRIALWSQHTPDYTVLLISMIGATGLNLTAADVVIHFVSNSVSQTNCPSHIA